MADEITATGQIRVVKSASGINDEISFYREIDMSGGERIDTILSVGFAAEEALPLGDVGTIGWCYLENLDATNFVVLRMATGHTVGIKLKAGECAFFRLSASAPFIIADSVGAAAVRVRWVVWED